MSGDCSALIKHSHLSSITIKPIPHRIRNIIDIKSAVITVAEYSRHPVIASNNDISAGSTDGIKNIVRRRCRCIERRSSVNQSHIGRRSRSA